jgi:ribosome-associated protein
MRDDTPESPADELPSKSELKRRSRGLQDLGDELVALPAAELDALDLPEDVHDAVVAARRITSHGARVRQRLYIGKLLRRIDTGSVVAALDRRRDVDRARVRSEQRIEQWRDRLLGGEESAWTQFVGEFPDAPAAELRALANQARAELNASRPPAAARKLFRRLRDILAAAPAD